MRRDPDRDDGAYLWDMLRHAEELVRIAGSRTIEDLKSDRIFRLAVERLIEIIGEASRSVGDETRRRHANIQWRAIEAQRHVLAHEYGDIDVHKIWRVVTTHVPELIEQLRPIVPDPPPDPLPEE
ncbi:MAG: DUF86 domain-containing protein [Phycisphaeraceae bacterium]|nr:MAG: DUF86 domain-containing protein [Phycisphaeraceae bacterium]